uniref:Uncharacterized protein n=1 Tax=Anguilla anguilla TaxID=7936 RepID=A0A0E9PB40_ANGAN
MRITLCQLTSILLNFSLTNGILWGGLMREVSAARLLTEAAV